MQWTYPIVWNEPGIGEMRLQAVVSAANEFNGWSFNDWIAADAETWTRLDRLTSTNRARQAEAPFVINSADDDADGPAHVS